MKNSFSRRNGLTLVEVVVIIAVGFILAGLLLPAGHGCKQKAGRIICVNNLKQVGLSFRIWAGDHDEQFPMQVSTNEGGVKEINETLPTFGYFQLLTNELGTPKVLFCPDDKELNAVLNFSDLDKTNNSYFIGVDATTNYPGSMLSGDRNITNGFLPKRGVLELTTNQAVGFTEKIHNLQGNIALGDGSVQQVSSARFRTEIIRNTGLATNRILLP